MASETQQNPRKAEPSPLFYVDSRGYEKSRILLALKLFLISSRETEGEVRQ